MTNREAMQVLGMLTAYFPRAELPEPTLRTWAAELEAFDVVDATAAIRIVAASVRFPTPTLADVLDAIHEVRQQRAEQARYDRQALTEGSPDPQVNAEGVKRVREMLSKVGREMP